MLSFPHQPQKFWTSLDLGLYLIALLTVLEDVLAATSAVFDPKELLAIPDAAFMEVMKLTCQSPNRVSWHPSTA